MGSSFVNSEIEIKAAKLRPIVNHPMGFPGHSPTRIEWAFEILTFVRSLAQRWGRPYGEGPISTVYSGTRQQGKVGSIRGQVWRGGVGTEVEEHPEPDEAAETMSGTADLDSSTCKRSIHCFTRPGLVQPTSVGLLRCHPQCALLMLVYRPE